MRYINLRFTYLLTYLLTDAKYFPLVREPVQALRARPQLGVPQSLEHDAGYKTDKLRYFLFCSVFVLFFHSSTICLFIACCLFLHATVCCGGKKDYQ